MLTKILCKNLTQILLQCIAMRWRCFDLARECREAQKCLPILTQIPFQILTQKLLQFSHKYFQILTQILCKKSHTNTKDEDAVADVLIWHESVVRHATPATTLISLCSNQLTLSSTSILILILSNAQCVVIQILILSIHTNTNTQYSYKY